MLLFNQLKRDDPALRLVSLIVLAGLGILFAGLWWVQVVCGREYQSHLENQSFRSVRVPAPRGKILDRNGVALADNRPRYDVCLYLEDMRKSFAAEYDARYKYTTNALRIQREARRAALGRDLTKEELRAFRLNSAQRDDISRQSRLAVVNTFTGDLGQKLQTTLALDVKKFTNHAASARYQPFPLMQDLRAQQVARFHEQFAGTPGVDLEMQTIRKYPFGTTAAHLLGYLKRENESREGEESYYSYRLPDYRGEVGVESGYDVQLSGHAGGKSVLVNNLGYRQSENIWQPTVPGFNAVLTLDLRIQQAAERALARVAYTRGAIVVMDTRNGDVLALASSPTFDPNKNVEGISDGEQALRNDATQRPLINRATYEIYQPGSVFKIITGMAALEKGLNPDANYTVEPYPGDSIHGVYQLGSRKIRDTAQPGSYNFRRAFIKSSNSYFIHCGVEMGLLDKIAELGRRLHFGERCNLPTRQDSAGIFPTPQRTRSGWSGGDTANLCIGQAQVVVTPLQVAVMVSAVANGGTVYWPRLVQRLEPQDPLSTEAPEIIPAGKVRDSLGVSARTLNIVRAAMLADVDDPEGSGRLAAVPGMRIGGKTGTAQVMDTRNHKTGQTTWFASFGGTGEDRRYAVVVMIEDGKSGADSCAPLAKLVYEAIQQTERPPQPLAANGKN